MEDHRIRLTDRQLSLIVSALVARQAGVSEQTAREIGKLADRLVECSPGNPAWRNG